MTVILNLQIEIASKASISKGSDNLSQGPSFIDAIKFPKENLDHSQELKSESEGELLEVNDVEMAENGDQLTLEPNLSNVSAEPVQIQFQRPKLMLSENQDLFTLNLSMEDESLLVQPNEVVLNDSNINKLFQEDPVAINDLKIPTDIKDVTTLKSSDGDFLENSEMQFDLPIDKIENPTPNFSLEDRKPSLIQTQNLQYIDNANVVRLVDESEEDQLEANADQEIIEDIPESFVKIVESEEESDQEERESRDNEEIIVAIPHTVIQNVENIKPRELNLERNIGLNFPNDKEVARSLADFDNEEYIEPEDLDVNNVKQERRSNLNHSSKHTVENLKTNKSNFELDNHKIEKREKVALEHPRQPNLVQVPAQKLGIEDRNIIHTTSLELEHIALNPQEIKFVQLPDKISGNVMVQKPSEQINIKLHQIISTGVERMEVVLTPENLGRVEIVLEIKDGSIKEVKILASRIETLESLIKDSKILEQVVREVSKDSNLELNFGLRQDGSSQNDQSRNQSDTKSLATYSAVREVETISSEQYDVISDSKVDVRL